jgi:hypothetical protein
MTGRPDHDDCYNNRGYGLANRGVVIVMSPVSLYGGSPRANDA